MKLSVLEVLKKIYARMIPVKKDRVIFWDGTPGSGSNIKILYKEFKRENPKYDSIYFTRKQYTGNLFKYITLVSTAKVIITSHGCSKLKKNQTYIECWHGVPLKKMALLCNEDPVTNADKFISSSETYTTLLNACMGSKSQYPITGFPRNDYFFKDKSIENIVCKEFNIKKNSKKIVFMPTFRKGLGKIESDLDRELNIFGFNNVTMEEINEFLEGNNIHLLVKLHPVEEAQFIERVKGLSNMTMITGDYLRDRDIDIYEILNFSDALITDYSSVYFDYLLTNKPIIFLNNDIKQYENSRGFLLEPISFWLPGNRVKDYIWWKDAINEICQGKDPYAKKRSEVCNIIHRYNDGKNCKRVIEEILSVL